MTGGGAPGEDGVLGFWTEQKLGKEKAAEDTNSPNSCLLRCEQAASYFSLATLFLPR